CLKTHEDLFHHVSREYVLRGPGGLPVLPDPRAGPDGPRGPCSRRAAVSGVRRVFLVAAGPPYPELAEGVIGHNVVTHSYWSYYHEKEEFLFRRNPLSHFHPANFFEFCSTRIALSSLLFTFSMRAWLK